MTKPDFHRFLVDPKTSARLDAAIEDNARIDAAIRQAQHDEQFRRYIDRLFAQTERY